MEPDAAPAPSTFKRRPEDVVASNGREVEQFALECCVKRQLSTEKVPKPSIPAEMLDAAYERCREVTAEYAKTFYLGAFKRDCTSDLPTAVAHTSSALESGPAPALAPC